MSGKGGGKPLRAAPGSRPHPGVRLFSLVGHRSCGKTQLAEALLAAGGVVRAAGRVDDGTALLDHDAESSARRASLFPSFAWIPWRDRVLHLVDTPGAASVALPARLARFAADLDVVVVSVPDGVERGTEEALVEARRRGRPAVAALTKLDRGAELGSLVAELGLAAGRTPALLQLPWREDGALVGVIDLLTRCALRGDQAEGSAPSALMAEIEAAREQLLEAIATTDEGLLEAYLERLDLNPEEAWAGLARGAAAGELLPVVIVSGLTGLGAGALLDAVWELAPDPEQAAPAGSEAAAFVAQWVATVPDDEGTPVSVLRVWAGELPGQPALKHVGSGQVARVKKLYRVRGPRRAVAPSAEAGQIVAVWEPLPGLPGDVFTDGPAVSLGGAPRRPPMAWAWLRLLSPNPTARRVDEERLRVALERLRRLDPGLAWEEDGGGVVLAGVSPAEVQLAVERLRVELGEVVSVGLPPVRYRERLVGAAAEVHGLHRKADGDDVLELGECWLDVRPTALEKGFEYEVTVDDDVLPRKFWGAVGEGARWALARGPLADCPVIGVHVTCVNGEYDALESVDAHFEAAGELAMRAALERCGTELMEPWSDVVIHLPGGLVGALMSDLPAHRGRVLGLEVDAEESQVHAWLPDAEVLRLGGRLEALASGRAWFVATPSHYERLPVELVSEVLKQTRATQAGGGR